MKRCLFLAAILLIAGTAWSRAYAEGDHIKYNLDTLSRKAGTRVKEIDKKMAAIEREVAKEEKLREIDALYTRAEELYREGRLDEARELSRRIEVYCDDTDVRRAARSQRKKLTALERKKMREKE